MGILSRKNHEVRGTYDVQPGNQDGKELPGVAGYKHEGKLPSKNSLPPVRFKYVRPDGRPD
jgi:hypothetical protein